MQKYSTRYYAKLERDADETYLKVVNGSCPGETDTTFSPKRFSELFTRLDERDRKNLLSFCCNKGDHWNIKFLLENGVPACSLHLYSSINEADILTVRLLLKYVNILEAVDENYYNKGVLQMANAVAHKGPLNMEIYHLIKAKYDEDLQAMDLMD